MLPSMVITKKAVIVVLKEYKSFIQKQLELKQGVVHRAHESCFPVLLT